MAERKGADPDRVKAALDSQVHDGSRYVAFGNVTPVAARIQAERLGDVGTWGPLQRVVKVAQAWKLLAAHMERDGAATVQELEPDAVVEHAERLWVIPPEGGMVEGIRG